MRERDRERGRERGRDIEKGRETEREGGGGEKREGELKRQVRN